MNTKVSVVIPSYNSETYISKTIESVLNQTESCWEIILVDNASTDKTVEIAKNKIKDQRLKIFINPQNLGLTNSLKLGIQQSKGQWITILDSDDWYDAHRLEKLLQLAELHQADMIADDIYYIADHAAAPWTTLLKQSRKNINQVIQLDPIQFIENDTPAQRGLYFGLTRPLIKRDFLLNHQLDFDDEIELYQDFWFYLKCVIYGARFFFVPQPYYFYRLHSGSLSQRPKLDFITLTQKTTHFFIRHDFVNKNPGIRQALLRRLSILESSIPYYRIVDSVKHCQWRLAVSEVIHHPSALLQLIGHLPRITSRLIAYHWSMRHLFF